MAKGGLFSYIKEHWVAYLIGAAIAAVLGFGLAYFLGVKWSTPDDVRAERIAAEQDTGFLSDSGSSEGSIEF